MIDALKADYTMQIENANLKINLAQGEYDTVVQQLNERNKQAQETRYKALQEAYAQLYRAEGALEALGKLEAPS